MWIAWASLKKTDPSSECQVDVCTRVLSGSELASMRVVANDGFHTSQDDDGMEALDLEWDS